MKKSKQPPTPVEVPEVSTEIKYRYACPACTGIAFKSYAITLGATDKICADCHRPLSKLQVENYIML